MAYMSKIKNDHLPYTLGGGKGAGVGSITSRCSENEPALLPQPRAGGAWVIENSGTDLKQEKKSYKVMIISCHSTVWHLPSLKIHFMTNVKLTIFYLWCICFS